MGDKLPPMLGQPLLRCLQSAIAFSTSIQNSGAASSVAGTPRQIRGRRNTHIVWPVLL